MNHKSIWELDAELGRWADRRAGRDVGNEAKLLLRNLSKNLYVCEDATPVSLAAVLVTQICWVSKPDKPTKHSMSATCNKHLHRGPWAGDRFDVCFLHEHEADLAEMAEDERAAWKDVGVEIAEKMEDICKSEYGKSWEEKVCKTSLCSKTGTSVQ